MITVVQDQMESMDQRVLKLKQIIWGTG